ncbi:MAG: beta-galactosidase trimerization domain-containing protein [Clostridia bacterium]|nr:beta-galactosidase trimerization domain-containing protein [Clostridia bacterium]
MSKWYKGIYRRQLTDMHIHDEDDRFLSEFSADEYYENLVRANIQSPMIYLQSHTGLCNYPTETARTHKRFLNGENQIKKLIKKCKDGGMKVVGYYSLIFNNWAAENHPSWEQIDEKGKTWRENGQRYGLCCPNNEEYRAFVQVQIDELVREFKDLHLDGIFFDMPYWEITCCCPSCQKRFQEETGKEIPKTRNFKDETWLRYVKARQDWMVDFVRFVRSYTNQVMPEVTVEFNYAAVIGCNWLGGSTEGINDECEFTGGDLYGDLYSHSFACKYYYGVTKNQPFEYMTCRCDKTLREHTITKPQATLEREILLTAAHHGASLNIDAVDPIGTLDKRVYERVGKAFARQIPFEPYMGRGNLYSEVAVYFDSKTMYTTDTKTWSDRYNRTCAIGAVKKLIEAHVPTAVISNNHLGDLSKYQMIVAPALQDFDNDEPLKFIDYVKKGGTLYLSGASDSRLIKEFFGGKVVGETYENSPYPWVQMGARVYVAPKKEYELEFGEFNEKYPLPFTYYLPILEGAQGEVKATITLPFADPDYNYHYASIHSCPPWQETEHPAFIEKAYGKGKVIWSAAVLEYDDREAFKDIFKGIVERNVVKKYVCKAGKAIECVIFEEENATLFSLCDLQYDETKTSGAIPFTVRTDRAPKSFRNIGLNTDMVYSYDEKAGVLSATLSVDDFAMFEITY